MRTDEELDDVFGDAYNALVEELPDGSAVEGPHCDTAGYRALYELGLSDARDQWVSVGERLPPENEPVMVDGGPAIFRRGEWLSMVESPHRVIQWEVKRWCRLPMPPQAACAHWRTAYAGQGLMCCQDCGTLRKP